MVRPSAVFELGIHHVSRPLHSLPAAGPDVAAAATTPRVTFVPPDVGFVHHYRDCTNDYEDELDCDVASFVVDARIVSARYIPALRRNVQSTLDAALRTPPPPS